MSVNGVIQRLFIEIDSDEDTVDHQRSEEIVELLKTHIIPFLEKVLQSYFSENSKPVRIPELHLDFGSLDPDNWVESVRSFLHQELPQQLSDAIAEQEAVEHAESRQQALQLPASSSKTDDGKSAHAAPFSRDRLLNITLHFLESGAMPWWALREENVPHLRSEWLKRLDSPDAPALVAMLIDQIKAETTCIERLLQQFGSDFIAALLNVVKSANKALWTAVILIQKQSTLLSGTAIASLVNFVLAAILNSNATTKLVPKTVLKQWFIATPLVPKSRKKLVQVLEELPKSNASSLLKVVTAMHHKIGIDFAALLLPKNPPTKDKENTPQKGKETLAQEMKSNPEFAAKVLRKLFKTDESGSPLQQSKQAESIYVDNAGIVLLSPFIPHFLTQAGVLKNKQFETAEDRCKAVYTLHYLATGEITATEDALFLPKVLCRWPIDKPLPACEVSNAAVLDTLIEALWEAVKARWSAMKRSQFDGLRSSFLKRPGKLEQDHAGHWTLTVESHGMDMLLQYIDWSIYMIRHTWMDEFVYVEWGK
jgi:hypothetical protein